MSSSPTNATRHLTVETSYLLALAKAQIQQQQQQQQQTRGNMIQNGLEQLLMQAATAPTVSTPSSHSSSPYFGFAAPAKVPQAASVSDLLMTLLLKKRAEASGRASASPSPSPVTPNPAAPSNSQDMGITTDRIQQIVKLMQSEEGQANRDLFAATPPPPTLSPSTMALCQRMGVTVPPQYASVSTRSMEGTPQSSAIAQTKQAAKSPVSSTISDDGEDAPRQGRAIIFPKMLHMMLRSLEAMGQGHVASYTPDGSGFVVRDPKEFSRQALTKYCTSSNYASFQRQVNLYCFRRSKNGGENVYSHPMFHRDQPELCLGMVRTKIKNGKLRSMKSAV